MYVCMDVCSSISSTNVFVSEMGENADILCNIFEYQDRETHRQQLFLLFDSDVKVQYIYIKNASFPCFWFFLVCDQR